MSASLGRIDPGLTITITGKLSRWAKLGLWLMRAGVWLVNKGGVVVTTKGTA